MGLLGLESMYYLRCVISNLKEEYFPEIEAIPTEVGPTETYDDLHWEAVYNWTAGNFRKCRDLSTTKIRKRDKGSKWDCTTLFE
jgi:hypothetical protein